MNVPGPPVSAFQLSPNPYMLTGELLLTALNRTKRTVRVVALDGSFKEMTAAQVMAIVRDSDEYVGHGTKRKCGLVKRVGAQDRRKDLPWASCWRTMEAAIIPADGWLAAVSGR